MKYFKCRAKLSEKYRCSKFFIHFGPHECAPRNDVVIHWKEIAS